MQLGRFYLTHDRSTTRPRFVGDTFIVVDCLAGDASQDIASTSLPLAREGDSQADDAALALWPATFVHWDHVVLGAGVVLLIGAVLSGVRRKKPLDDESTSSEWDRLFAHWEAESDDSAEREPGKSLPKQAVRTKLLPARSRSYADAPLTVPCKHSQRRPGSWRASRASGSVRRGRIALVGFARAG